MKKIITIVALLFIVTYIFPDFLKFYGKRKYKEPKLPTRELPIQQNVNIYFNDYQVPYIEAKTDHDLAFTLGLVHAHYRLPQLEITRLVTRGEISKMLGPMANKIDHTLRIVQLNKVASEIIEKYPPETRAWLEAYLDGINYYIHHVKELPWDLRLLQIRPQEWTLEDLVAGFRMTTVDVNWVYQMLFLSQSKNPEWPILWQEYIKHSQGSIPSALDGIVGMQEPGSNSLVIGKDRSFSGASLIASDPQVSIFLPSLWLLCGYQSPSYHAVGITIPGVPLTSIGRNENIAWGATNMYSVSTFLFELEPKDMSQLTTIEEKIPTRFTLPKKVKIRNSIYGPVITDSPYIHFDKPLAFYWMGHQASDEITALLQMNRAKNWNEFQTAFHPYSIMGLNYLYADKEGNVGYVPAYRQPLTKTMEKKLTYPTSEFTPAVIDEAKLPRIYNPKDGFIASANNRPVKVKRDWGWFFAPDDRTKRQQQLVKEKKKVTIDDLKKLQLDTYSSSTVSFIEWIKQNVDESVLENKLFQKIAAWNGMFEKDLKEPVIFEFFMHELAAKVLAKRFHKSASIAQLEQTLFLKDLVREIMQELPIQERSLLVLTALEQVHWKTSSMLNWGQLHSMTVQYALGYLPWIGRAFQFQTMPASGANDTLFKRAFLMLENKAAITYGSSARHISDLSDLDSNYFVLFGAQNGYPFSPDNANQIDLWEKGEYIQMPMRLETVKKLFRTVVTLQPN